MTLRYRRRHPQAGFTLVEIAVVLLIVTFLMVFLIQKTQNKDSKAIQLKLNELIAASRMASNRLVNVEDLNEDELDTLHKFYKKLSDAIAREIDIHQSHSIDAAEKAHQRKRSALNVDDTADD